MRLATAEAAEQRACARLLAAEQRGHALGEQCRRLHARLGRTEVDLVGTCCRACCPSPTYQHPPSFLSCRGMALFCVTPVPGTLPFPETMQAQLRRQNESMLRDVSLKAGALREHQAKHDSSRVEIEQLQQQVRPKTWQMHIHLCLSLCCSLQWSPGQDRGSIMCTTMSA